VLEVSYNVVTEVNMGMYVGMSGCIRGAVKQAKQKRKIGKAGISCIAMSMNGSECYDRHGPGHDSRGPCDQDEIILRNHDIR